MPTIKGIEVTDSQLAVYNIIGERGPLPDHALVPLTQHSHGVHLSSSGIRTRRCELVDKGLIESIDAVRTGSGRLANVFGTL